MMGEWLSFEKITLPLPLDREYIQTTIDDFSSFSSGCDTEQILCWEISWDFFRTFEP